MIKVIVNGAKGKMGAQTVQAVTDDTDLQLVGALDVSDDLSSAIQSNQADVVVDFTIPSCVKANTITILQSGAHAVVGTTGLTPTDLSELDAIALQHNVGVFVCPNFAIGAVMMMKAAQLIAPYLPHVEIIEAHHEKKIDAPSGTAIKTAELINASNPEIGDIPIHSVRLPGHVAHQDIIFGGLGQRLLLRHDSISRDSFMPGVIVCIKQVISASGLTYGLENII